MAETLTVDTSPDTEVLTADEQESLEIGEKMEAAQDNLLAGKYKDAQELEKAYIELQTKLGETGEKESEPEAVKEEDESEKDEAPEASFLDRLWEEAQGEYKEETMKELSEMDPKQIAQMHIDYRSKNQQPSLDDKSIAQLKDVAGGDKAYERMLNWAGNSLDKGEVDMFDKVMEQGNPLACFFAIQSLKYRYDDATGVDGNMLTGKAPSSNGTQFKSQAQVVEAMNDPKYDNDPAYRREVMEKLERSDLQF